MIGAAQTGEANGWQVAITLGIIAAVGSAIAASFSQLSYRDPQPIAAEIEKAFPDLDQRLNTALQQTPRQDSQQSSPQNQMPRESLSYLQTRVIREAREHGRKHDWLTALPGKQLWLSRIAGVGAIVLLMGTLVSLANAKPNAQQLAAAKIAELPPKWEVIVEPGNAEIERGSSLAITARFRELMFPEDAELVCKSRDGSERRIRMTQNLDDPIVGGFIGSVDDGFVYQVVTEDWSSEDFTVDVFEYPSLVRSDAGPGFPRIHRAGRQSG